MMLFNLYVHHLHAHTTCFKISEGGNKIGGLYRMPDYGNSSPALDFNRAETIYNANLNYIHLNM